MFKKKFFYGFIAWIIIAGQTGCKTSKQLPYFKDLSDTARVSKLNTQPYAPLKLQANDELQITISSTSPEASQFFNVMAVTASVPVAGSVTSSQSQGYVNLYRVNSTGFITLPVLGNIPAAGLTTEELQKAVAVKLKDYLKDPVVIVTLTNFKVTVIGEVSNPVMIPVNGQTINVLEAIGAAGDMTVFGIRKNVKVVRKLPDGNTEVAVLDFNKSSVMQSPYFQLKQNDIVYVQPNNSKGFLGTRVPVWIPIVTSVLSLATIFIVSFR